MDKALLKYGGISSTYSQPTIGIYSALVKPSKICPPASDIFCLIKEVGTDIPQH